MRKSPSRWLAWRLAALMLGAFLLGGCDAQTQAAVEDGVISTSTSLVGAFLQAFIQLKTAGSTT